MTLLDACILLGGHVARFQCPQATNYNPSLMTIQRQGPCRTDRRAKGLSWAYSTCFRVTLCRPAIYPSTPVLQNAFQRFVHSLEAICACSSLPAYMRGQASPKAAPEHNPPKPGSTTGEVKDLGPRDVKRMPLSAVRSARLIIDAV